MVLWLLAYIIIGQVAVPMGLSALGIDRDELTVRGHAGGCVGSHICLPAEYTTVKLDLTLPYLPTVLYLLAHPVVREGTGVAGRCTQTAWSASAWSFV